MYSSDVLLQQSIEAFWQTFPSTWRSIHTYTHNIAVERYNITMAQFIILRQIHYGRTSVSRLADAGHISRPAISRQVDILVNKQLVNRVENTADRRHVSLSLTDRGKQLMAELYKETHQWMEVKMGKLSSEELSTIICALELLRTTFVGNECAKIS
jgi:DNA-binding MarR family transcriptional regulator